MTDTNPNPMQELTAKVRDLVKEFFAKKGVQILASTETSTGTEYEKYIKLLDYYDEGNQLQSMRTSIITELKKALGYSGEDFFQISSISNKDWEDKNNQGFTVLEWYQFNSDIDEVYRKTIGLLVYLMTSIWADNNNRPNYLATTHISYRGVFKHLGLPIPGPSGNNNHSKNRDELFLARDKLTRDKIGDEPFLARDKIRPSITSVLEKDKTYYSLMEDTCYDVVINLSREYELKHHVRLPFDYNRKSLQEPSTDDDNTKMTISLRDKDAGFLYLRLIKDFIHEQATFANEENDLRVTERFRISRTWEPIVRGLEVGFPNENDSSQDVKEKKLPCYCILIRLEYLIKVLASRPFYL